MLRSPTRLKRRLISIGIALGMMVTGTVLGWHLADQLQYRQTKQDLSELAERISTRMDEILVETILVFDELENLGMVQCSDELLLEMRTRLFEARFIQDIGGFEDRSLYCSTALGRLAEPYRSGPPDLLLNNGFGIRTDRTVLASDHLRTMVLERDPFNALIDTRMMTDLLASVHSSEIFLGYHDNPEFWHPFHISGRERIEQLHLKRDKGMLARSCSQSTDLCVLVHHDAARGHAGPRETRTVISGLGGAFGLALFFIAASVLRERNTPERVLKRAISNRMIRASYQPILTLPEQDLVGFEALARWTDENGKRISPEEFIALAEDCGLIEGISKLMIEQIGSELGEWLSKRPNQRVAINIAASELAAPELIENLDRHLLSKGVRPNQIILEVTERTMMQSKSAAQDIERLNRRGFSVYADDFGVGYCGLAYLNELEIQGIKISQSFTAAVATDSPKAMLVARITEMAQALELCVVIEGVETREQCDALSELKPIMAQGWLFSRELSAAQLKRFFGDI
jgi:sensor c-di-GMP phosphodiesterase-like protein